MNRQQKEKLVQELNVKFDQNEASFVVNCQGMTVAQLHQLRLNLAKKDGELKVAKNRLTKLAIVKFSECDNLSAHMKGQNAVVFAKSDFTGVAKILYDFAKKNEELKIVAGCCEAQLFDKAGVAKLAKIPSREVLLAQLLGVLNAPIVQFACVINQVMQKQSGGATTQQAEQ